MRDTLLPCRCAEVPLIIAINLSEFSFSAEGTPTLQACSLSHRRINIMNGVIYLIGLVVVVLAILSFLGLH